LKQKSSKWSKTRRGDLPQNITKKLSVHVSTFVWLIWRNGRATCCRLVNSDFWCWPLLVELWITRKLEGNMLVGRFSDFSF